MLSKVLITTIAGATSNRNNTTPLYDVLEECKKTTNETSPFVAILFDYAIIDAIIVSTGDIQ